MATNYEIHLTAYTVQRGRAIEIQIEFFEDAEAEPVSVARVLSPDGEDEFEKPAWDEDLNGSQDDYDMPPDEVLYDLARAFLKCRGY
ncbi:hypothetical protein NJC40_14250 [Pseudomonas sp. 21LCFQ02]|uniref:hypothetical protein n=1 Tax=unclassified Pseudomonas TaxID=196821 RepID=UPI00209AD1E2|nr:MULTISPECIES: hypothetical protein [unclassified Pseudomonas]MCO8168930.1 hypothetical protein [Pseudomonas sp. 21LCFQ02]MCQ9423603.1 hypothetical protein [Pseudomonas sp. LJDD11]